MKCTTCQGLVSENDVGICMACQMGFKGIPQHDSFEKIIEETKAQKERSLSELLRRKEKIEEKLEQETPKKKKKEAKDANEIKGTKKVSMGNRSKNGKGVRRGNTKEHQATKEGETKKG